MTQFLTGERLRDVINQVMGGTSRKVAVAFIGGGAERHLFGQVDNHLEIICDLTMGSTDPDELTKLGAPRNQALRHIAGLHTKVYLSTSGLVVGSANASDNAFGFSGQARLVEAAVFAPPSSECYAAAVSWFTNAWSKASIVDEAALERAREAWQAGPRRAPPPRNQDAASLLDAVIASPASFRGVGFVFSTGSGSKEARDAAAADIVKAGIGYEQPILAKDEISDIYKWPVDDVFYGWTSEDINAWPKQFVCCHMGSRGGIRYYFYERAFVVLTADYGGVVLARPAPLLKTALGLTASLPRILRVDQARLKSIFEQLDDGVLYESAQSLLSKQRL